MKFDYNSYIVNGLIVPLLIVVFVGLLLTPRVVYAIKQSNCFSQAIKKLIFPMLAFGFVLITTIPTVSHTVFIPFENKESIMVDEGKIDKIYTSQLSARFGLNGRYVDSAIVSINGKYYLFMSNEKLYTGKRIRIEYLPKSRIILSWEDG